MNQTALYAEHVNLGAKMVPFAGFMMPVQYTGIIAEHDAVRKAAGLFDVSHMGEFIVKGDQAEAFLQSITSNDVEKLVDGKAQYSCLPNAKGGIIDDLLVYRIDAFTYMLVVNAGNIQKDLDWILLCKSGKNDNGDGSNAEGVSYAEGSSTERGSNVGGDSNAGRSSNTGGDRWEGLEIKDISERTALLAIQGPLALGILQKLTPLDLKTLSYYSFKKDSVAGVSNVLISATGYTGAGGFELYFDKNHAVEIWNKILEAGKNEGLIPAGLGSRDTLRLEMGYCLYGNDINDSTSPLEAGLGWITRLNKDFTASEILKAQKENGLSRKLAGFELKGRGIPRHGYEICDSAGNKIGEVTSGTQSPSLQCGIGMGYVSLPNHEPETIIYIMIREQAHEAIIVPLPFYKK